MLDKVYDAVTEEFSRDAMASLATVLAHICIITNVAKPKAIEAMGHTGSARRGSVACPAVGPCSRVIHSHGGVRACVAGFLRAGR